MLVPMGSSADLLAMADWPLSCPHCGLDAIGSGTAMPSIRTHNRHPEVRALARLEGWAASASVRSFEARPRGLAPQDDGGCASRAQQKSPAGAFSNSHSRHQAQCASAQTFFLVKYIK